jgi:murein DD-endopeptidase MepM/ murein hydrolase activator NlpD
MKNKEKTRILAHLHSLREASPRHFWAGFAVAGVSLFSMVAAFGTAPSSAEIQAFQQTIVEQLAPPQTGAQDTAGNVFVREERVQRGDSVASLLARLGVQDEQAFAFLRQQAEAQSIFRQLRPGKVVTTRTTESGELLSLTFPLNGPKDNALIVERRDGRLQAAEQPLALSTQVFMKSGEIRSSLFGATDAIGLPDSIATQMADIFGGDIDFHRDLRRGDRFSVVYEVLYSQGQPVRTGRILATEFVNNGKTLRAVWFESRDGQGYYTPEGKNIRKAFLRSPLEFSRISSGFTASRFHPILQTWRAHKGVDYAAPVGTRVKATGDGVVEFVGRQGGYGNLVVVRHQSRYSTHYGHLNGFAAGIRKGMRVSQGDVIGYVGKTGWATGPHLHYEFRINDVHQNPLAIALPSAPPLAAQQMAEFRKSAELQVARLDQIRGLNLALLD